VKSTDRDNAPNHDRLRSAERLWRAWEAVRRSALESPSARSRAEALAFEARARTGLEHLGSELAERKFDFGAASGAASPRPGKAPRAVAFAAVRARIVQRALLDELLGIDALRALIESPNSFGGIHDRGRSEAIREVLSELREGKSHWLRSGINGFFAPVPREAALQRVRSHVDEPTGELLVQAVSWELSGAAESAAQTESFADEARDAAPEPQLSSALGNVALSAFDLQMNGRGVRCLRHVDTFLLLGLSEQKVMKAHASALELLARLGMAAGDGAAGADDVAHGRSDRPFDFLGCSIQRGLVRPSRKAIRQLLDDVDRRLEGGARRLGGGLGEGERRVRLARVFLEVGSVVSGWRKSFDFCDRPFVFCDVDKAISLRLARCLDEI